MPAWAESALQFRAGLVVVVDETVVLVDVCVVVTVNVAVIVVNVAVDDVVVLVELVVVVEVGQTSTIPFSKQHHSCFVTDQEKCHNE